ncbi:hypothetical protein D3C85_1516800 [compost metagenome]
MIMCPAQAPTSGSLSAASRCPRVSWDHWLSASVKTRMSPALWATALFRVAALPWRGRSSTRRRGSFTRCAQATVSSVEPSLARMTCSVSA